MIKFAVFATQRSGTGLLTSVLNKHPEIILFNEIFLDQVYNSPESFYHLWLEKIMLDPSTITIAGRQKVEIEYLENLYNSHANFPAVGFNIKYDSLNYCFPELLHILSKFGVHVIHIIRRNVLKTHISSQLNIIKRQLNRQSHDTKSVKPVKVSLPQNIIPVITRRVTEINHWRNLLSSHCNYIEILYEDFFNGVEKESATISQEVLSKIFNFLQVSDTDGQYLATELRKTNPSSFNDLVVNHEEIRTILQGTQWEFMVQNQ